VAASTATRSPWRQRSLSIDVSQYQGFGVFQKTGSGTAILTGTTTAVRLDDQRRHAQRERDGNLGATSGALTVGDAGTLQSTATFSSGRAVTLSGGSATFDAASGTNLTLNGTVSGLGALVKQGAGTLTLAAPILIRAARR